jgi:hypothetical protein
MSRIIAMMMKATINAMTIYINHSSLLFEDGGEDEDEDEGGGGG